MNKSLTFNRRNGASLDAMSEIPFWIHDRPKWVSGISRHTTCQDILFALVKSERKSKCSATKDESDEDAACKEISRQLAVVEQWRGVERPLSHTSKILKLWQAWRDERKDIKFVIKRISSSRSEAKSADPSPASIPSGFAATTTTGRSRKPRRRTSRASSIASQGNSASGGHGSQSEYKKTDTVHPNALKNRITSSGKLKNHEIERLMRIILAQGETIHNQLKKLQEREGQIESIEEKVHDTRTRTAGKDYLINSYLKFLPDGQGACADVSYNSDQSCALGDTLNTIPDRLQEMLDTLTKVYNLNEDIHRAEEKIGDLRCQLGVSDQSGGQGLENSRAELRELRGLNDAYGKEIDANRHKISLIREAVDARQAVIFRLERDMGTAEMKGKQLELQLQAIEDRRQHTRDFLQQMSLTESNLEDELDGVEAEDEQIVYPDDIFLKQSGSSARQASNLSGSHLHTNSHFLNDGHFRISNEELYSQNHVASSSSPSTSLVSAILQKNPRRLLEQLQRQTHYKLQQSDLEELHHLLLNQPLVCNTDAGRSVATGSPGSASSSGNSSGSGGCGSEKSFRFSERDTLLLTPELPADPLCGMGGSPVAVQKESKSSSAGKSMADPLVDTDSNSDTGLSSLHSSSDEGTYILDTLV